MATHCSLAPLAGSVGASGDETASSEKGSSDFAGIYQFLRTD